MNELKLYEDDNKLFSELLELGDRIDVDKDGTNVDKIRELDKPTMQQLDSAVSRWLGYLDNNNEAVLRRTQRLNSLVEETEEREDTDEFQQDYEREGGGTISREDYDRVKESRDKAVEIVQLLAKNQKLLMKQSGVLRDFVDAGSAVQDFQKLEDLLQKRQDSMEERLKEREQFHDKRIRETQQAFQSAVSEFKSAVKDLGENAENFSAGGGQTGATSPSQQGSGGDAVPDAETLKNKYNLGKIGRAKVLRQKLMDESLSAAEIADKTRYAEGTVQTYLNDLRNSDAPVT